jgi:hypothetical protein
MMYRPIILPVFYVCEIWLFTLAGETSAEGVWEKGVEEDIWN